jgi:hypothetical protein
MTNSRSGSRCPVPGRASDRDFLSAVQQVPPGENRMAEEHAGARISHDLAYLLSRIGMVAVNRAPAAGRLVLLEWALFQALEGIIDQPLAFRTKSGVASVAAMTV